MNYAEEYVYWYLRLNGFFPITNFVIHKSSRVKYTSDCDVIAIRPPYVYEEIGGKPEDWDQLLSELFHPGFTTGVICEVKSGDYDLKKIFQTYNVEYSVGRLGFSENIQEVAAEMEGSSIVDIDSQYRIIKLLFANEQKGEGTFLFVGLDHIREFLRKRISDYPEDKYRDRMFFGSILFQSFIDNTVLEKPTQGE